MKPEGLLAARGPDHGIGGAKYCKDGHTQGSCEVRDAGVVADKERDQAQQGCERCDGTVMHEEMGGICKQCVHVGNNCLIGRSLDEHDPLAVCGQGLADGGKAMRRPCLFSAPCAWVESDDLVKTPSLP